jgi:hypothetical protein
MEGAQESPPEALSLTQFTLQLRRYPHISGNVGGVSSEVARGRRSLRPKVQRSTSIQCVGDVGKLARDQLQPTWACRFSEDSMI